MTIQERETRRERNRENVRECVCVCVCEGDMVILNLKFRNISQKRLFEGILFEKKPIQS